MSSSATAEASLTPKSGGSGEQARRFQLHKEWKGIGVVYARANEGVVELSIFYESHIPQEIKDELAERFGVGIYEWRVSK